MDVVVEGSDIVKGIQVGLKKCYAVAVRQGFDGSFEDWNPTSQDLEFIVDKLPRRPTESEWKEAGLSWVGGTHCADK